MEISLPYETRDINQTGKSYCAFVENTTSTFITMLVLETRISAAIIIIIKLISYCNHDKYCQGFPACDSPGYHIANLHKVSNVEQLFPYFFCINFNYVCCFKRVKM